MPWTENQPLISDYAFLSDCATAALVSSAGSVDWWCLPRFDSPSVFGRLLGEDAGHWLLAPVAAASTERTYLPDSLVLSTVLTTQTGSARLTEVLTFRPGARGHRIGKDSPRVLLRTVEGLSGMVEWHTELRPRMEYGRTEPHTSLVPDGVDMWGGPVRLTCTTSQPLDWTLDGGCGRARFSVTAGDAVEFRLQSTSSFHAAPDREQDQPSIGDTLAGWESWAADHVRAGAAYPDLVRRSSLVLQGLTYAASGAIIAAATTGIPETVGGTDAFDYRYAWVRDLSLTTRALWIAACPDEPQRLFGWLATALGHIRGGEVPIMFGVEGERDLTERELPHLPGYRASGPVRVGNAAWEQKQTDVVGEVLDAALLLSDVTGDYTPAVRDMLLALADRATRAWREPDAGMWEARDAERHYTSSKVFTWVALDRAVQLADKLGDRADPAGWAASRDQIKAEVLDRAWCESIGAYAGAYDSDHLDASVLLLPIVGFLPMTDPRMAATVERIADQLGEHGPVRRWGEEPNGFLLCTFWLVECLAMGGQIERADALFRLAAGNANDVGLLSEMVDSRTGAAVGNVPQAFSHVGLINAAWRLEHPEC